MTTKTDRKQKFERRATSRDAIILGASTQGPVFLKPSFAITAQPAGLTVNVSARPEAERPRRRV